MSSLSHNFKIEREKTMDNSCFINGLDRVSKIKKEIAKMEKAGNKKVLV